MRFTVPFLLLFTTTVMLTAWFFLDSEDSLSQQYSDAKIGEKSQLEKGDKLKWQLELGFSEQEVLAYHFEFKASGEVAFSQLVASDTQPTLLDRDARGTIVFKFQLAPNGWQVTGFLVDYLLLEGDAIADEGELSSAFSFHMAGNGAIDQIVTNPDDSSSALIETLLTYMQWVLPETNKINWITHEHDATGKYQARYSLTDLDEKNRWQVVKQKEKYLDYLLHSTGLLNLLDNQDLTFSYFYSKTQVDGQYGKTWFEKMQFDERYQLDLNGEPFEVIAADIALKKVPFKGEIAWPIKIQYSSQTVGIERYYLTSPSLNKLVEGKSLAQVLAIMQNLMAEDSNATLAYELMVNYLRLKPSISFELASLLSEDPEYIDEEVQLFLWLVIGKAGHAEAQQALFDFGANEELDFATRFRGMSNLFEVEFPTKELIINLTDFHQSASAAVGSEQAEIASVSLYLMGELISDRHLNVDVVPMVENYLRDYLHSAEGPDVKRKALVAIANSAHPRFVDDVSRYFEDPDPNVRSSALASMMQINGDNAQQLFYQAFEREASDTVKAGVVMELEGYDDPRHQDWALEQLEKQTNVQDEQIMASLLKYVGEQTQLDSVSNERLKRLAKQSESLKLKRQLYKYISLK